MWKEAARAQQGSDLGKGLGLFFSLELTFGLKGRESNKASKWLHTSSSPFYIIRCIREKN